LKLLALALFYVCCCFIILDEADVIDNFSDIRGVGVGTSNIYAQGITFLSVEFISGDRNRCHTY
jgi:hypothetical protein